MSDVVIISIEQQRLQYRMGDSIVMDVAISTAKNGPGEQRGSECTPRGWHKIRAKIGAGFEVNSVFAGRRPTGEVYSPKLRQQFPGRDWVLTRILWLSGIEPGKNRLASVDTMQRYIYIHGCPVECPMGVPGSHGCVRMHNEDLIALFDQVDIGTRVLITEGPVSELV
jgi:hypothetical protein